METTGPGRRLVEFFFSSPVAFYNSQGVIFDCSCMAWVGVSSPPPWLCFTHYGIEIGRFA